MVGVVFPEQVFAMICACWAVKGERPDSLGLRPKFLRAVARPAKAERTE